MAVKIVVEYERLPTEILGEEFLRGVVVDQRRNFRILHRASKKPWIATRSSLWHDYQGQDSRCSRRRRRTPPAMIAFFVASRMVLAPGAEGLNPSRRKK